MPSTSDDAVTAVRRPWHVLTVVVSLGSMLLQVVLTVRGIGVLVDDDGSRVVGVPTALVRFFSYFTIQSNILVTWACWLLAARPDRDGPWFRVVRIASLYGITVTFVVYLVALRPILDLEGLPAVTDAGLHIVTPLLVILGFLLFGPRPRLDVRSLLLSLVWPVAYFVYSLVHGAVSDWYPYPFVDVVKIGYAKALTNLALVVVLLLAVGAAFLWLDRRLPRTSRSTTHR